jgi:WD40 repeat protein
VFSDWLDEDSDIRVLWLHALPASGKSVLSSFIITELLNEDRVCACYFFRFGDQTKRSLSNCLRSLAYQTAEQLPSFQNALLELNLTTAGLGKLDARAIWQRVFCGVLFKQRCSWPIYWVIDALDEADDRGVLLEFIQTIPSSFICIKVLLVSRQTTELVTQFDRLGGKMPMSCLALKNSEEDIRTYVESEINYLHALADYQTQIVDKLLQGAHNNFLWVSLALKEILECNTMEDLEDVLEGLPPDMEHLYRRMEDLINPKNLGLAKTILTWAACSRRPLTMDELAEALKPEFAVLHELDVMINRVCGQFVVVDSTKHLIMVHQTAREYLMRSTNSRLAISSTESHKKMFAKCMLMLEKMPQRHDSERRGSSAIARIEKQPFSYAITSWAYHLNLCSADDKELKLLSRFLQSSSVLTWISALAHLGQLKRLVYASKSLNALVRRMRKQGGNVHPTLHRLEELELTELWAIDFLKILGKFGTNLADNYTSIQHHIAPFCPRGSMIYQKFAQKSQSQFALSIRGLSGTSWDDSLAKLSLGNGTMPSGIRCSGIHVAILASGPKGKVVLYNALTFEIKHILEHNEFIKAMSFSNKGDRLVSSGFRTTKLWDLTSGSVIRQIPNPPRSRALDISFSPDDTALLIGSEDRMIWTIGLKDSLSVWSLVDERLLKDDNPLDRSVSLVPYKMAFDTDLKHVAVAYRGSPLSVWSIDPPELIGQCLREESQLEIGNSWTVVDQVKWQPQTEEILGLYQGGHVFKWHPYNGTQLEVKARASLIACSPEGTLFATGDHNGTIKLFNFDDFSLLYQLSFEDMVGDITFSPDSKRLYDLRGQFCNVWEPNALIRLDETDEPNSEVGSEVGSTPISEVVAEIRDPITAMSVQPRGHYHAVGNDSGVVSVVDTRQGSNDLNEPLELWKSSSMMAIINLDWSENLKHLACGDLTGRIVVLSVNPPSQENFEWISKPVSQIKIELDGGVWKFILNHDGTLLMVENGSSIDIWSLDSKSVMASQPKADFAEARQWIKHPTDSSILLALNLDCIRAYRWTNLDQVLVLEIGKIPSPLQPQGPVLGFSDDSHVPSGDYKNDINRLIKSPASSHILMQSNIIPNQKSRRKQMLIFDTNSITSFLESGEATGTIEPLSLPPDVQSQVEIPLGILPRKGLIFLNKDYWMCSWNFGTRTKLEKVQRHFFLPKDWLNSDCLNLCALLECGTFLIPKNGEVAIIKSGVMSGR